MKTILLFLFINLSSFCFSQKEEDAFFKCNIAFSADSQQLRSINAKNLKCISTESNQQLLVYVYEWWCKPCNEKLLEIKAFADNNNLKLIVLTIAMENTKDSKKNEKILTERFAIQNIAVLNDEYGKNFRKKYKVFLTEISKDGVIEEGLSKFILYGKNGSVKYISSIEDKDILESRIVPLLEN